MIPLRLINIISRMFYIHIRLKDVSVLITPIAFLSRNRYICTINYWYYARMWIKLLSYSRV